MLGQLTSGLLRFFIFLILSFSSDGGDLGGGLVLRTESWQGFVQGGGLEGRDGDVDLSTRVEDPVSSFEDLLVSVLRKCHVTYVGPNIHRKLVGPDC